MAWRDPDSAPCLLAIARFEGPGEQSEPFQEHLIQTVKTHLAAGGIDEVIHFWDEQVGVSSPAQRICQKEDLGALLFGALTEESFDAHIVFSTGQRLTHIDNWSRDRTSIPKRDPIEPAPGRTKLSAKDEKTLVNGLVAYLRAALARMAVEVAEASAIHFQPQLPEFDDELMAMTCCRQAEFLQVKYGVDSALEWLERGLDRLRSPRLLHAYFRLLYEERSEELFSDGSEINELAIRLLREAAAVTDDPERPQALYNLLQVLPEGNDPAVLEERFRILDLLNEDPTYRNAWWVERMRGSLHYRIATRQRAFAGDASAQGEFGDAARSYSRALRLRRGSQVEEPELGPAAPARIPRSPVLQANAYDAHHYAGNRLRAAWHHRRAKRAVGRLFKYGVRAMMEADLITARRMFELQLAVGWSDAMAARASVMATFASEALGDKAEAENYWRRALEIDEITARTVAIEIGLSVTEGGQTGSEQDESRVDR
ncbi:MAG TPA: hypothetical protein VFZ19_06045 [Solirubrobacterales bacterium]